MFKRTATDQEVDEQEEKIRGLFCCDNVTDEQVRKVAVLCKKVEKFLYDNKIDALAIRC